MPPSYNSKTDSYSTRDATLSTDILPQDILDTMVNRARYRWVPRPDGKPGDCLQIRGTAAGARPLLDSNAVLARFSRTEKYRNQVCSRDKFRGSADSDKPNHMLMVENGRSMGNPKTMVEALVVTCAFCTTEYAMMAKHEHRNFYVWFAGQGEFDEFVKEIKALSRNPFYGITGEINLIKDLSPKLYKMMQEDHAKGQKD